MINCGALKCGGMLGHHMKLHLTVRLWVVVASSMISYTGWVFFVFFSLGKNIVYISKERGGAWIVPVKQAVTSSYETHKKL